MEAKEYLNQLRKKEAVINADIEELENLITLATKVTSVINDCTVQSSGDMQKVESYSIEIKEMKDKIAKELVELINSKKELKELIKQSCSTDCITLLHKRYFQYKKWEEIAIEMGYSYQWVSDGLHKKALEQVNKALERRREELKKRLLNLNT